MKNTEVGMLLEKAYKAKTEDNYWNQITPLRQFVNGEMISKSFQLIDSDDLKYKQIGIDILCQLGQNREIFIKELFEKVFTILETLTDEKLINSSLFAIAHNNQYLKDKDLKALEKFQYSTSKDSRFALTHALLGIENKRAVKMLIKLAQDRSPKVRDWATFGLGTQIKTDTQEIRDILYKNCFAKDNQTRSEAIQGLVNRKDERVKDVILNEIRGADFNSLLFDSIIEMNDNVFFLSELIKVYDLSKSDESIDEVWMTDLKNCIEILKTN